MKPNYLEVPERLKEYRLLSKLSQEQASQMFAVTQSHYSKLEKGTKIISYESLKAYERQGGDIDYLITGKSRYVGIVEEYAAKCTTALGRIEMVKSMLWVLKLGLILCKKDTTVLEERWKYIQIMDTQNGTSIWERIRKTERVSQENMAEKLDINIKRYRKIEKLEVTPDAEILHSLYAVFGYLPQIIMDENSFCMSEINKIWDEFPVDIQIMLKRSLDYNMQLICAMERTIKEF